MWVGLQPLTPEARLDALAAVFDTTFALQSDACDAVDEAHSWHGRLPPLLSRFKDLIASFSAAYTAWMDAVDGDMEQLMGGVRDVVEHTGRTADAYAAQFQDLDDQLGQLVGEGPAPSGPAPARDPAAAAGVE